MEGGVVMENGANVLLSVVEELDLAAGPAPTLHQHMVETTVWDLVKMFNRVILTHVEVID